ncbi:MAG TPA: hypothetical protein VMF89_24135, partial [Polyangiales bacterium]|nr:hypothetical protein [Polyangiales bacterium]
MRNVFVVAVFALWASFGCGEESVLSVDAGDGGGGELRDSGSEVVADAGTRSDAGAKDASTRDAAPGAPDDAAQAEADGGKPPEQADGGKPPELADGESLALSFRVVDAEYSSQLERIVIVAAEPNRLIVLDPETGKHDDVELPLTP